ncbi:MAG: hypothetical protein Kow0042_11570 [Calditrichia bacterium]
MDMDLVFNSSLSRDIETLLSREWIEIDSEGNYSSSTIIGLNTRKRHGLLVMGEGKDQIPFLLLSHLQEELFDGEKHHPLFSVEYKSDILLHSVNYQTGFRIYPVPTFLYQVGDAVIQKSIMLIPQTLRLLVYYKITGDLHPDTRLIVKPFFAFRQINQTTRPELFVNQEVFLMEQKFRFLPYPEAPEIFVRFSAGQFIPTSVWYHHFKYRHDKADTVQEEDILNPGFFNLMLQDERELLISFGLHEWPPEDLSQMYKSELERRASLVQNLTVDDEVILGLRQRLENFSSRYKQKFHFLVPKIPFTKIHLSSHFFMAKQLIHLVNDDEATKIYARTLKLFFENNKGLTILQGNHSDFKINAFSSFGMVLFVYNCLNRFKDEIDYRKSLLLIDEIISSITKNKMPLWEFDKERIIRKRAATPSNNQDDENELYFPRESDFLDNLFWYNILKIASQISTLIDERNTKYERLAEKVQGYLINKYIPILSKIENEELDFEAISLHPMMIFSITLPFTVLNRSQSRFLYLNLLKHFLNESGIKFPVQKNGQRSFIVSPILLNEFLEAWQLLLPEKPQFYELFSRIAGQIHQILQEGLIGYFPEQISPGNQFAEKYPVSGLSTMEVLCFLVRLERIRDRYETLVATPTSVPDNE